MGLSELCIRRPVLTTLVTATIIVFGVFAYRLLGVAALPSVDFPTIQINAQLPGASAETMAASVASPIERQLSTISGITSLTSTSSLGRSSIIVQFDLNRNIDSAALDVQTALTVAARRLPIEMTTPPSFRKVNPGDFAVLVISVNSQTLPLSKVNEYAETADRRSRYRSCPASRRSRSMARRNSRSASRSIRWPRPRAISRSTRSAASLPRPIPILRSARCMARART